jgi:HSP20 family protein
MNATLTRWTPASELLRSPLDRLLNQSFSDFLAPIAASEEVSNRRFMPPVDIRETSEALIIHAELPGLHKDDVVISLENQVLTLSGERSFQKDVKEQNLHRIERSYGTFSRSFMLPTNVQSDKVQAAFQDGVLTITLPKVEEAKPRKIEIR